MKVIDKNGKSVYFDQTRIYDAIEKINVEVKQDERATKEEIDGIIDFILDLDKKRMLAEDIQDIVEEKLMDYNRVVLAKNLCCIEIL